ncbi:MAG: PolC-type DNA polymerase III [Clostridia bacterium]|nr:PolC-type DNA polymerase III [Clostridia bacterium]
MNERFYKQFAKVDFTEEQKTLLKNATDYKLQVDRAGNGLKMELYFPMPVPADKLFEIENTVSAALRLNYCLALPIYEGCTFATDYMPELVKLYAYRANIALGRGGLDKYDYVYDREKATVTVKLRKGISSALMDMAGAGKFFSECVFAQFGQNIAFNFEEDGNYDYVPVFDTKALEQQAKEDYAQYEKSRAPKEVETKDSFFKTVEDTEDKYDIGGTRIGNMHFDLSERTPLFKELIRKEPFAIKEIHIEPTVNAEGRTFSKRIPVCICGELFQIEDKESRDGSKTNYKAYITDGEASVMLRFSVNKEDTEFSAPKPGAALLIEGKASYDDYEKETVIRVEKINKVKRLRRKDKYPRKRTELHLHTAMSANDALSDPETVMATASAWGWNAVAITDHGNVQAYPMIMKARKKYPDVKPIYGMEGYLVDDTARAVFGVKNPKECVFDETEFIIFDIETTGLSPVDCAITEIGASLYKGGEIIDTFGTYVDPEMPIPENITRLTGISEETVKGAPKVKEAVKAFLEFAGDRILVAHNANFDIGFIRKACETHKIKFTNPYLDTLPLSRYINSDLNKHTLDSIGNYYNLGEFNHHRATDDTAMLGAIFSCMADRLRKQGIRNVEEMNMAMAANSDPKKLRAYHITILVKNLAGLRNLYQLISQSYLDYYHRNPRIPKTVLDAHREGLIIGSACEAGELFRGILDGKPNSELERIAKFYDYLEIMPKANNSFLIDEGTLTDYGRLEEINKQILRIGDKLKKPVCATGDSHFIEPDDEIYRQIMQVGLKYKDAMHESKLYLRTTEEMLDEFSYLGDRAEEVVIDNPQKIADMVDGSIKPIPDGTYTPEIEGAEEELTTSCHQTAMDWYGYKGEVPEIVKNRLDRELTSIIKNGFSVLYVIARKLVLNSERTGYLVGSRGSVGSSVVATFSGVSEVNPLPPHYRCPNCKYSEWFTDGSVGSGFDLPDKICPKCGEMMISDGHDIPFETFLGFHGEKAPDIDLNFSSDNQSEAHHYTEVLFGKENIFRAGTVGTIASKTAYGYVKKFLEEQGKHLSKAEENRLVNGLVGVKRTTGQHPGGIVVIPKQYEIYDFTPVQHPADKDDSGVITTHFAFEFLHDTLLKLDILGHDVPTIYKWLETFTGKDVRTVPMNDRATMELFESTRPLGVTPDQIGSDFGTFGLPECGTPYVREMIRDAHPTKFSDLLQLSGLSHGTGIWLGNGQELIKNGTCTISEIIGTRDSIMVYLMYAGVEKESAFKIMEFVRKNKKGLPIPEAMVETMRASNVPEWYIESLGKIRYMFPKAHAAAYMISAIRLGWYKVHEPLAFYATYFTVKCSKNAGFDSELALSSPSVISKRIEELEALSDTTAKDEDTITVMQMVREMYARGIKFLPVDVYKSEAYVFKPEDGKIRLPLSALNGLGDTAAENIYKTIHETDCATLEELRINAGLNKNVVEILKANNCLGDLPETDQLSLF